MNNLQLIVLLPLFQLQFPANAQQFLIFMSGIANFDLLPTDEIFDAIFQIESNTNSTTENAGSLDNSQFLVFNVYFE